MPEQENDGLVPPLKILRKRLNGVYRADGFSGPTRRYVLIVALLVGLASLPTLAAITAGTDELDGGTTGAMDVPFLPPPSSGPVVPVRPAPSPSVTPGVERPAGSGRPGGIAGEPGYAKSGRDRGSRGNGSSSAGSSGSGSSGSGSSNSGSTGSDFWPGGSSSDSPAPSDSDNSSSSDSGDDHWTGGEGSPSGSDGGPSSPDEDAPVLPGSPVPPGKAVPPNKPSEPSWPWNPSWPGEPSRPADPDDRSTPPGRPLCHERGKCGSHESRHHRPDWSRHRHCEESTHRAHWWSHHREGRSRSVVVHIVPTGRHGHHATIREQRSDHDRDARAVSRPDAGRSDSERHNSGRHDAEPNDAGRRDAEHRDAGRNDSERGDSGNRDAGDRRIVRWQKPPDEDHEQPSNSINQDRSDDRFQHRSDDRSEHSRRSTMTERPQNIRPARTTDRTQNSRRTSESRWDEPQSSSRSYHGSHRAPSMHHADDGQSAAHDRISRVGRHHASRHEEHSNRR